MVRQSKKVRLAELASKAAGKAAGSSAAPAYRSWDDRIVSAIAYLFVSAVALVMLYPVLNVFAVAFSSYRSYSLNPWIFFPYDINLDAFRTVFASRLIMNSYVNTLFITMAGTILTLIITVMTAYPLSREGFRGKAAVHVAPDLHNDVQRRYRAKLPADQGPRPVRQHLGLEFIPGILSAFNVILMINFFKALPDGLIEAAKVDGAGELRTLWQIVVPLSKPILSTIALFAAVGYGKYYFSAIMYIRRQALWPVQLVLREIIMAANTAMINSGGNMAEMDLGNIPIDSLRYASLVVVMLPIMCIYPFLQKYFAKGVLLGAVKG